MEELTEFEREVLEIILAGDHPALEPLRAQAAAARVSSRDFTGVGFFTELELAEGSPRAPLRGRVTVTRVYAELSGVRHGAGFVLWVEDGLLSTLEGFTYDDPWPEQIEEYSLHSIADERGDDTAALDEAMRRDAEGRNEEAGSGSARSARKENPRRE